jgi:hypothetical protein
MSCLFQSLAYFVKYNGNGVSDNEMRSIICDYLRSNPDILGDTKVSDITNWESGKTLEDYVSNMENTSSWGTALEIKAFCDIFGVKVNVHCDERVIEFLPTKNNLHAEINIKYINRNHYIPILDQKIN